MNPDDTTPTVGESEEEKKAKKRERQRRYLERAQQYSPLLCKDCGQEIYQTVTIEVKIPLGWHDLTKNGMRNEKVTFLGARWEQAIEHCGCEPRLPGRKQVVRGPLRRRKKRPKSYGNKC